MYSHWSMFPSASSFSCKQRAHTKVVITGLEEWDWKKKRKKAFSAAFSAGPFVSVSFPLFCAGGQRQQRQESKVKRWKENEKKQDGLRGREYTVGDGGGNKRTFHRGRTHSQFSHTIGKPLSDRMRFFQPVSNHRYHKWQLLCKYSTFVLLYYG